MAVLVLSPWHVVKNNFPVLVALVSGTALAAGGTGVRGYKPAAGVYYSLLL